MGCVAFSRSVAFGVVAALAKGNAQDGHQDEMDQDNPQDAE